MIPEPLSSLKLGAWSLELTNQGSVQGKCG